MRIRRSVIIERRTAQWIRKFLVNDLFKHTCACCGRKRSSNWHLDHPHGRRWKVRSCSRLDRMKKYLHDIFVGNLRLLCHSCNERDGARRRWEKHRKEQLCTTQTSS